MIRVKFKVIEVLSAHFSTRHNVVVADSFFNEVLSSLPDGISCAFAYGSGVYQQHGNKDKSKNMLDLIIVVDDPVKWHQENIALNHRHYSFLKNFGHRFVSLVQRKYGAGVYFNTLIPFNDQLVKYGVISVERLITDLLDWDTLYVSGRLHKPVLFLKQPSSNLKFSIKANQKSAVHSALLQLPELFTEKELYMKIAGLSYKGDFRMTFGENKNKVANIVQPNMEMFRLMYENILDMEEHIYWHKSAKQFEQYQNHISQFHHLNLLPKTVQINLMAANKFIHGVPDAEEVFRNLAHDPHCDELVAKSIEHIVRRSSRSQSVKTIFTAGILKSVRYSWKKLLKMLQTNR